MGLPAAKKGDQVVGVDIHIVLVPPLMNPSPLPHPFAGILSNGLSTDVKIMGQPAATVGSTADNVPPHIPMGASFQQPPKNKATIQMGSATVKINGKAAARMSDKAMTCNDPSDLPSGTVIAAGNVLIG